MRMLPPACSAAGRACRRRIVEIERFRQEPLAREKAAAGRSATRARRRPATQPLRKLVVHASAFQPAFEILDIAEHAVKIVEIVRHAEVNWPTPRSAASDAIISTAGAPRSGPAAGNWRRQAR
jgi:hypothetical protein